MARNLAKGRGMLRVAWDSSGHVLECFDRKVRREGDRVGRGSKRTSACGFATLLATALQCWRFPILGSQVNFGPDCGLRSCLTEVHIFQLSCPG